MSDQPSIWPEVIGRLVRREDLPPELVEEAIATILGGQATDAQIAGFAVTLRAKGETVDELAALVRTMLQFSAPLERRRRLAGRRHLRHRRRPSRGTDQRLDDGRAGRGRRGRAGRQARQPCRVVDSAARPTCSKRSGS